MDVRDEHAIIASLALSLFSSYSLPQLDPQAQRQSIGPLLAYESSALQQQQQRRQKHASARFLAKKNETVLSLTHDSLAIVSMGLMNPIAHELLVRCLQAGL